VTREQFVNLRILCIPAVLIVTQLILLPALASPPSEEIRFKRYSVDQGLSQSQVSCVLQDHEGFIWLGTQDGLDKFDGYTFTVYRHNSRDTFSISDDYINCLFEDASGTLWIGTYNGGLNCYDRSRDGFRHFVLDTTASSSITGNSVWSITEDSAHTLWIGVWGGGLNRFDPSTSRWTTWKHIANDSTTLADNRVLCQRWDYTGRLWIGTFAGLDCFDPSRRVFTHMPSGRNGPRAVSQGMVTAILEDRSNNLWVGTLDNGLDRIVPDRSRIVHYAKASLPRRGLSSNRISALMQDAHGTLWIATRDGGVNLMDADSGSIRAIVHDAYDPSSLSMNAAISLYQDAHGGVWVGTDGGGVSHYDPSRFKFGFIPSEPGNPRSLAHPLVRSLCEDRRGRLWVGMMEGNMDVLDFRNGGVVHLRESLRQRGLTTSCQVLAVLQDSDARIWVGTDGAGLFLLDESGNVLRHFLHNPHDPQSIPDDYVVALYEARDGTLWIGGTSGAGLGILERSTYRCRTIARRGAGSNQLGGNYVWAIREDQEGNMWLGTWGAGITVLDPATSTFRVYHHDPRDASSLSNNSILAFHLDAAGSMWIGTLGGGLDRFDRASQRFEHHTEADGLPSNTVSGILSDNRSRLWLSTNKGIACYDPATHAFRKYDVSDGVQSAEFNQGAYCQGRDGRISFGGINGVNRFLPESIIADTCTSPIRLTAFTIQDRVVTPPRSGREFGPIVLPSHQRSFSCEFALLNFVAPEKIQYRYMLEGLDHDWIQAGTRRYASYTNLSGGDYHLRVQARNSDGMWSPEGASFGIRVHPPYWETLWFKALVVGAVFAFGFIPFRVHTNRFRREQKVRAEFSRKLNEYQEDDRRRIAGELHDSLGQDLLLIRNSLAALARRSRRGTRLAREVGEINDSVQRTIEEVSRISFDLHPHMLDRLGLKKTLEATIRKHATSSGLNIRGDIDDVGAYTSPAEQINIFRIIQEAVTNVLKHAGASRCVVTLRRTDQHCQITIEDNGSGFDPVQVLGTASGRGGYGLGNMEERVRFLHGSMQIRSAPGQGTTLVFMIPLMVHSTPDAP